MYSVLDKLILYSFLIFPEKVLKFLNFLTGLVLASYKENVKHDFHKQSRMQWRPGCVPFNCKPKVRHESARHAENYACAAPTQTNNK